MVSDFLLVLVHLSIEAENPDDSDNPDNFDDLSRFTSLDKACELSRVRVICLDRDDLPDPPNVSDDSNCGHEVDPKEELQKVVLDHKALHDHFCSEDDHAKEGHRVGHPIVLLRDEKHLDVWVQQLVHHQTRDQHHEPLVVDNCFHHVFPFARPVVRVMVIMPFFMVAVFYFDGLFFLIRYLQI